MKAASSLFLALAAFALCLRSPAETYLRIDGGVEQYSDLATNGLPAEIAAPLRERMIAGGYLPYVPTKRPPDTWCTTQLRTLVATNGTWREVWTEASVPVKLDRTLLVEALLELPDGTNLLAAALASEPVAAWFAGEPTYVRGSPGAQAVGAALGIPQEVLEALAHSSLKED